MEKKPSFPIKQDELATLLEEAGGYLRSVTYAPSLKAMKKSGSKDQNQEIFNLLNSATGKGTGSETINISASLLNFKKQFSPGLLPMSEDLNTTFLILQRGIALGMYMREAYAKASGLTTLEQMNSTTKMDANHQTEFVAKQQTATAVLLFSLSYYVLYYLASPEDRSVMKNKFGGIPEVDITTPTKGLSSVLYYYGRYLSIPDFISTEKDVQTFTTIFFEALLEEIGIRKDSLKYTESFKDRTYQLEDSEFTINGWDAELNTNAVSVEFNKVKFEEIVGNLEAKHREMRIIAMMLSFDFQSKDNPFNKFGGFPTVRMGYGKPGTGKSMLIAAVATRLKELCDWLGYPFLFWPFPDNIVSTFQGGSAERALDWFRPLRDTGKIIYAPIDDAENSLQNRSHQGVSAGVMEVIGVFLRQTEGAYAVNHGNYSIGIYTNLPDKIDPAVLSRIQYRAPIDGAVCEEDFMDQMYLWLQSYNKLDADFLTLQKPEKYSFLEAQKKMKSLNNLMVNRTPRELITQDSVLEIYESTSKKFDVNSYDFFGTFYLHLQKKYPGFTSREVRNINTNVGARIMDFDLPDEVWKDEKFFFHKTYDEKLGILTELVKANMKSLKIGDLILQEALKSADNYARISDTELDRMVESEVQRQRVFGMAQEILAKEREKNGSN